MKARDAAERPVATSQELLQSALRRSSRRNARVARRRLWWRWTLWGLMRALRWLGPPALLLGALALWWHGPPWRAGLPATAPARAPAVSAAASANPATRPLRIDNDAGPVRQEAQAQSTSPSSTVGPSASQETP